MISARPILLRSLRARQSALAQQRLLSAAKKPAPAAAAVAAKKEPKDEDAVSVVTQRRQEMRKSNPFQVMGPTGDFMPAPVLPEDPKEVAALDPADERFRTKMDGTARTVVIRQEKKSARQAPLDREKVCKIAFYEDGMITQKWENPLMGWTSNSDPYQLGPPLTFRNAADAVYFAKKRGWNYIVKKPIIRYMRFDDAQYQDNFLPQAIASKVQREGTSCDYWHRTKAGTSNYFRPLNYHGTATVRQHGPNQEAKIAPDVPGYYKMR